MKSLLKLPLAAFCLLLSIRVLVAQKPENYMTSAGGGSPVPGIIGLLIALLMIVAMWKVFTKAGQPGWASIIPIYNLYIWCKIVGRQSKGCSSSPVAKFASHSDAATGPISVCAFR